MKILSLFDGISCGMVALERAGIPVDRYVAYEIDKYAIQVSEKNYPLIEHCGDVTTADFSQYKGFDMLIGGSPCTYWSIAKKGRETTPDGMGGQLFMHYVRALKESGCKYFLYENNYSIAQGIKDFISEQLGVQPIMINSALVSAQQRKRCYWTNIPNVEQPQNKGILAEDIIESDCEKPVCVAQRGRYIESGNRSVKCDGGTYQAIEPRNDGKLNCVTTVQKDCMIAEPIGNGIPINTISGKTHTITASYYKCAEKPFSPSGCERGRQRVAVPVRIGKFGNGGQGERIYSTTGVIPALRTSGSELVPTKPVRLGHYGKGGQAQRIYSVRGKTVAMQSQSGGQGAKTGLYKIDLPDGDYIIRKLTPIEAERAQTLPDNYTEGISNTQRYKCIGNGWTVDVIAHILKGVKTNEVQR